MTNKTYFIPNIHCMHCVMHITNRLNEIEGVESVEGNPQTREVEVEFSSPATEEAILQALAEINYPAEV
ncbi:MAG: heavy-metal-associated domain-containing protein [Anaerolineales bacterium]|nr:heavy-metal-associated domain-containing protein [Anaerolineales bacterium]